MLASALGLGLFLISGTGGAQNTSQSTSPYGTSGAQNSAPSTSPYGTAGSQNSAPSTTPYGTAAPNSATSPAPYGTGAPNTVAPTSPFKTGAQNWVPATSPYGTWRQPGPGSKPTVNSWRETPPKTDQAPSTQDSADPLPPPPPTAQQADVPPPPVVTPAGAVIKPTDPLPTMPAPTVIKTTDPLPEAPPQTIIKPAEALPPLPPPPVSSPTTEVPVNKVENPLQGAATHGIPAEKAPYVIRPVEFQPPLGMIDDRRGIEDRTLDQTIQLEPPGANRVFRLESEAALNERMRQEGKTKIPREAIAFPDEPVVSRDAYPGRHWPPQTELAEPNYVCYGKLLFEDKNAERYGWDFGILQPVVSTAKFYADLAAMPYHIATAPCRHDCSAGLCLPGDPVPYLIYPPEFSVTGSLVEAGSILGLLAIFP